MNIILRKTVKKFGISDKYIKTVVSDTLKLVKKTKYSVSISIVGEMRIRTINRLYRNIDYVTDVLSFPIEEEDDFFGGQFTAEQELGDIFICPHKIKRQAKEFNVTYKEEFTRMIVHGVLHLIGYDHIKEKDASIMFPLQEKIVSKIKQKYV